MVTIREGGEREERVKGRECEGEEVGFYDCEELSIILPCAVEKWQKQ
ncbi:hypothetical protein [Bartonella raoultii]|nr:hypothetical protein [Bartonella raoultii]